MDCLPPVTFLWAIRHMFVFSAIIIYNLMELKIENVTKQYPNGVKALNNINLTIEHGMFGMLGPNGAGKSSLMRTIATLQEPDTGSITLGDINILKQKDELRKVL